MWSLIILALAIALFTVLFAVQNITLVTVNFFGWVLQERLATVLLVTLAIGVVVGLLVAAPSVIRRSMKIARRRRDLEEMGWQLQQKDQEIAVHRQKVNSAQSTYQELLTALDVTEPRTGLLKSELMLQEVNYLMQQMNTSVSNSHYGSVSLFLIETAPAESADLSHNQAILMRSLQATAQRLQQISTSEMWLHHDGKGRFSCVTAGLDTKTASEYGERVRSILTSQPLDLADGYTLPITATVGGAIAYPAEHLDSHTLLQQAQDALDHAHRRGRNRFRLVEAKG
ncbi:MAG: hypothetical protein Kow00121_55410 [Elainellaceae cyanobacterium]